MRAIALCLLVAALPARAAPADEAALTLADQALETPAVKGDWRVFTEAALQRSAPRGDGARLSIDLRYDGMLAPGWRAVFADRLDSNWLAEPAGTMRINTLKEAYVSWQASAERIVDLGRINARQGVALGYNPTDSFRAGALRSRVSVDPNPASLRENRLGSVMLRGQTLWADGSLTALYAPKLADQPSNAAYSPDFGATNARARWQLALSQTLAPQLQPQWILSAGAGQSPQLGLNLTGLVNDATVVYLECSGGRMPTLLTQALQGPDDSAMRSRLASGLSYTTANNVTLTLEYEYNGAGLERGAWDALRRAPAPVYGRYRALVTALQESPTRQALFLHALWQDALVRHLDVSAMQRYDGIDRSRLQWIEARYHWPRLDLALAAQTHSGPPTSVYGALPESRIWQLSVRYYY